MTITVLKPGACSTFQDLGRIGSQHLGVPVGGAVDAWSHRIANRVVGNPDHEGTLEITLSGPALRFDDRAVIAWCGADLGARLDGEPWPAATPRAVSAGTLLTFAGRRLGLRTYLAIGGGCVLRRELGSCATLMSAGLGGYHGRALRAADVIALRAPDWPLPGDAARTAAAAQLTDIDAARTGAPVRAMAGRDWAEFTPRGQQLLFEQAWRIAAQSDRMGLRLQGVALARVRANDLLSEAVCFGTIQVPPDGQPIVLMADRQTTGGYPKIAHVASVDLPRLAQYMPGEFVRFEPIELEAAQSAWIERMQVLDERLPPEPTLETA